MCPDTRRQCARVCSGTTAHTARAFPREAAAWLGIRAVQVDGGSEFMAEFEAGCRALGLPLPVPPPRSPQPDGIVERANRTARVECWSQYRGELTCAAMKRGLAPPPRLPQPSPAAPLARHETPAEFAGMIAVAARPQMSRGSLIPHSVLYGLTSFLGGVAPKESVGCDGSTA